VEQGDVELALWWFAGIVLAKSDGELVHAALPWRLLGYVPIRGQLRPVEGVRGYATTTYTSLAGDATAPHHHVERAVVLFGGRRKESLVQRQQKLEKNRMSVPRPLSCCCPLQTGGPCASSCALPEVDQRQCQPFLQTVLHTRSRTMCADWDAARYARFLNERTQPAVDLVRRIELATSPRLVVDLGCGPGNSTAVVAARWPEVTKLVGVDSSSSMLAEAKARHPNLEFVQQDVADFTLDGFYASQKGQAQPKEPLDVIFSNATFHWVPNHAKVFPQLITSLRPGGGVLAVQMPRNFDAPSHRLLHTAALDERWDKQLEQVRKDREASPVNTPGEYYDWLIPHCSSVTMWEVFCFFLSCIVQKKLNKKIIFYLFIKKLNKNKTEYIQIVNTAADVGEFVRTTSGRPFLDALTPAQQPEFLAKYKSLLAEYYRPQLNGKVLFPFRRFFLLAIRK